MEATLIGKRALALMLTLVFAGCASILDGPFNKNGVMVPDLLYANNGTGYVTYWDEESKSYKTYDQMKDLLLETPIYSYDDASELDPSRVSGMAGTSRRQNFIIAGLSVKPLTHLDDEGMEIQREKGCAGCHTK